MRCCDDEQQPAEGTALGQCLDRTLRNRRTRRNVFDSTSCSSRAVTIFSGFRLTQAPNQTHSQSNCVIAAGDRFERALPLARRDIDGVVSRRAVVLPAREVVRLIETHRLTVDQSREKRRRSVSLEPARLVG